MVLCVQPTAHRFIDDESAFDEGKRPAGAFVAGKREKKGKKGKKERAAAFTGRIDPKYNPALAARDLGRIPDYAPRDED